LRTFGGAGAGAGAVAGAGGGGAEVAFGATAAAAGAGATGAAAAAAIPPTSVLGPLDGTHTPQADTLLGHSAAAVDLWAVIADTASAAHATRPRAPAPSTAASAEAAVAAAAAAAAAGRSAEGRPPVALGRGKAELWLPPGGWAVADAAVKVGMTLIAEAPSG